MRRLGELLADYSLRTWIAGHELGSEQSDKKSPIVEAMEAASVFIACLGERAAGAWGQRERIEAAKRAQHDKGFVLCVVLLPGARKAELGSLPPPLASCPVFDFRDGITSVAPLIPLLWRRLMPDRSALLEEIVNACKEDRPVVIEGPAGSGKTAMARVVSSELRDAYPDGRVHLLYERNRGVSGMAGLILRLLRLPEMPRGIRLQEYRRRLERGRYLIVLDEADGADLTKLIPPRPSMALVIVRRQQPALDVPCRSFEIPLPEGDGELPTASAAVGIQPGYASDTPAGANLLDIQGPVDALCSVIAAKDVQPPLSIGLFGDWGAGKTFFIGRMRERVEALATASVGAEESAYCSSVRQVVFNAWHYADTNLWASLASRVFEGLAGADGDQQGIVEKLASSRVELEEARVECETARARIARARGEEEAARREVVETKIELGDLRDAAVDVLMDEKGIGPLLNELATVLHREDAGVTLKVAQELGTAGGRLRELGRQLMSLRQLWRRSRLLVLLPVVSLAVATALVIAGRDLIAVLPGLVAIATALKLLLGPVGWVLKAGGLVRERADELRLRQDIKLRDRIESLRRDEREAARRQEDAARQVEEAERTVEEIKSGKRLFRFIEDRSRPDAYEPYQGVVALVRQDFERLSELMSERVDDGDDAHLERIVLYIDDLDRCPAARVVQVLEAIHLLMASELFVVVVAVDPRWLLRSLAHHYQDEMPADRDMAPMPQDYLEKIFQIPFSLPPMRAAGFRRMVESLLPVDEPDRPGDPGRSLSSDGEADLPLFTAAGPGEGDGTPAVAYPVETGDSIELRPEGLRVLPAERDFMAGLGGVIGTPRGAKRLTNIYRLIRASLSPVRLEALTSGEPGPGFICVQLLLAVAIGLPRLAPPLFAALVESPGDARWADLVEEWTPPPGQEDSWALLREGLSSLGEIEVLPLGTFQLWIPDVARYSYGGVLSASSS